MCGTSKSLQKSLQSTLYCSKFLAGHAPLSYVLFEVGSSIVQVTQLYVYLHHARVLCRVLSINMNMNAAYLDIPLYGLVCPRVSKPYSARPCIAILMKPPMLAAHDPTTNITKPRENLTIRSCSTGRAFPARTAARTQHVVPKPHSARPCIAILMKPCWLRASDPSINTSKP